VKYQSEMPFEEHVSGKNIFSSTFIDKSGERKKINLPHCHFELPAIEAHVDWLVCNSKEQCVK
jgi:hypothetical protein